MKIALLLTFLLAADVMTTMGEYGRDWYWYRGLEKDAVKGLEKKDTQKRDTAEVPKMFKKLEIPI